MSDLFENMERELGFAGGGIYFYLYQQSGELAKLNRAIEIWQEAMERMEHDASRISSLSEYVKLWLERAF